MQPIKNSYHVAVPTAFDADEGLNSAQTLSHIASLYVQGIRAVLICGSTGEQHSLSLQEKLTLIDAINAAALPDDLEIIFGVASIRLSEAKILAQHVNCSQKIIASLIGFPPYIRPSQQEALVYSHSLIEQLRDKNILLYNNPARTGFDLSISATVKLLQHPQITGIKEAGDITKIPALLAQINRPIDLYCGGELHLAQQIKAGFNRLSSIAGNIYPAEIGDYFARLLSQQITAQEIQVIKSLLSTVYTENTLQNIKTLIGKKTDIDMGICRAPLGMA
ncbi:dihydrodipicolinate synthase family protein [Utexia brackfieldae]|uniref:dihydrodipicolinate synthase family protein n=1 Tax=Utexia brackfieldae TaxID=3074108 RepID=UPI00370D1BFF